MQCIDVSIHNWAEFQPRKDLKELTWFRIDTSIFDGETYFTIKNDGLVVFIYLLSLAAKKNRPDISINLLFAQEKLKMKKEQILSSIDKLEELQILHKSVQIRTDLSPTIHNNTNKQYKQTNITNNTYSEQSALPIASDKVEIVLTSFDKVLIKKELIESWAETYDQEFLKLSLNEMKNWVLANSHKKPKSDWPRFMNNWFKRGWEQYRKSLKSNPAKTSVDELMSFMGWEKQND
jgi:hypothetical protein